MLLDHLRRTPRPAVRDRVIWVAGRFAEGGVAPLVGALSDSRLQAPAVHLLGEGRALEAAAPIIALLARGGAILGIASMFREIGTPELVAGPGTEEDLDWAERIVARLLERGGSTI